MTSSFPKNENHGPILRSKSQPVNPMHSTNDVFYNNLNSDNYTNSTVFNSALSPRHSTRARHEPVSKVEVKPLHAPKDLVYELRDILIRAHKKNPIYQEFVCKVVDQDVDQEVVDQTDFLTGNRSYLIDFGGVPNMNNPQRHGTYFDLEEVLNRSSIGISKVESQQQNQNKIQQLRQQEQKSKNQESATVTQKNIPPLIANDVSGQSSRASSKESTRSNSKDRKESLLVANLKDNQIQIMDKMDSELNLEFSNEQPSKKTCVLGAFAASKCIIGVNAEGIMNCCLGQDCKFNANSGGKLNLGSGTNEENDFKNRKRVVEFQLLKNVESNNNLKNMSNLNQAGVGGPEVVVTDNSKPDVDSSENDNSTSSRLRVPIQPGPLNQNLIRSISTPAERSIRHQRNHNQSSFMEQRAPYRPIAPAQDGFSFYQMLRNGNRATHIVKEQTQSQSLFDTNTNINTPIRFPLAKDHGGFLECVDVNEVSTSNRLSSNLEKRPALGKTSLTTSVPYHTQSYKTPTMGCLGNLFCVERDSESESEAKKRMFNPPSQKLLFIEAKKRIFIPPLPKENYNPNIEGSSKRRTSTMSQNSQQNSAIPYPNANIGLADSKRSRSSGLTMLSPKRSISGAGAENNDQTLNTMSRTRSVPNSESQSQNQNQSNIPAPPGPVLSMGNDGLNRSNTNISTNSAQNQTLNNANIVQMNNNQYNDVKVSVHSLTIWIRETLSQYYAECIKNQIGPKNQEVSVVGLGGIIHLKSGSIKGHVMPDFLSCQITNPIQCNEWLRFFMNKAVVPQQIQIQNQIQPNHEEDIPMGLRSPSNYNIDSGLDSGIDSDTGANDNRNISLQLGGTIMKSNNTGRRLEANNVHGFSPMSNDFESDGRNFNNQNQNFQNHNSTGAKNNLVCFATLLSDVPSSWSSLNLRHEHTHFYEMPMSMNPNSTVMANNSNDNVSNPAALSLGQGGHYHGDLLFAREIKKESGSNGTALNVSRELGISSSCSPKNQQNLNNTKTQRSRSEVSEISNSNCPNGDGVEIIYDFDDINIKNEDIHYVGLFAPAEWLVRVNDAVKMQEGRPKL